MKLAIIFSGAVITAVISQLFFKKGVDGFSMHGFSLDSLWMLFRYIISNNFLIFGIFFYVISFIFWLMVLSKTKISYAYPITSINFVLVLVMAHYFLNERLGAVQYLGIFFIIFGVTILARG
ncbi:MAG: EamA family transporter [Candidatus Moraniibacteriota bacterium]